MIAKRDYKLSFHGAVKSPLTSLTAFFVNLGKLRMVAINLLSGQESEGKGTEEAAVKPVLFISKAVTFPEPH